MKCSSGKISYQTREIAEEALIQNRAKYGYKNNQGPISVYQCEKCGLYHFTSKGEQSELLKSEEVQKRISLEHEANFWERKLR